MKIEKMTTKEIKKRIKKYSSLLDNPLWIKKQNKHDVGVMIFHIGLLNKELKKRGN